MIDWDRVCALKDEVGSEDFDEVVTLFLEEVDDEIKDLNAVEPDNLEAKLHFLKGSALSLGFERFSQLCQSGESKMAKDTSQSVDLTEIMACYHSSRSVFLDQLAEKTEP